MKQFVLGIVVTLVGMAGGVFLVSRLGLFPVGADNPPSSLERNLASRAMNVYVDNHKPAGDNPMPPTSVNLAKGAEAYESNCAVCHGGARTKVSPLHDRFSPSAPQLINRIPHDPDAWLFWVTKHGVRMTGMPAWEGVLSDDDMWMIVAFIKHSNTLPPEVEAGWRALAAAPR